MESLYAKWRCKPIVDAVMGFKGFQMIAAMMIVSEVGDVVRFTHPKQLMSYLGLTPGEYSSGGKSKRTGITKCGNSHARWILVKCAIRRRAGSPNSTGRLIAVGCAGLLGFFIF